MAESRGLGRHPWAQLWVTKQLGIFQSLAEVWGAWMHDLQTTTMHRSHTASELC